jgi:hypothetical protein
MGGIAALHSATLLYFLSGYKVLASARSNFVDAPNLGLFPPFVAYIDHDPIH